MNTYKFLLSTPIFLLVVCLFSINVLAADHKEAPLATLDPIADIADVYAFIPPDNSDKFVVALTFAGLETNPIPFDENVLYSINIDNNLDFFPDKTIYARFGQNSKGDWGVEVQDIPGSSGPIIGAINTVLKAGNIKVFAGQRDDPFFFDAEGFANTLQTGDLSFDSSRDTFAGFNVNAIVIEMALSAVSGGSNSFTVSATTGRKQ